MSKKKHHNIKEKETEQKTKEPEKVQEKKHEKKCCGKKEIWQILTGVFFVAFVITLIFAVTGNNTNNTLPTSDGNIETQSEACNVTSQDNLLGNLEIKDANVVAEEVISFMETFMLNPEMDLNIILNSIVVESGQYKINVSIDNQELDVYASLDGVLLSVPSFGTINMPEVIQMMEEAQAQQAQAAEQQQTAQQQLEKTDKPKVELFVMAYCPYGTQFEKGILPVLETLGDKIDFQLKFVNYSMHGTKESAEELNQYCINQKDPEKLIPYLSCFLEKDTNRQSIDCMNKLGINTKEIQDCVLQADKDYNIITNYKTTSQGYLLFPIYDADNKLYNVEGSPTFVVNGTTFENQQRDPQSILETICSAFSEPPSECDTNLSTVTPAPGFGYTTSGNSGSGGTC